MKSYGLVDEARRLPAAAALRCALSALGGHRSGPGAAPWAAVPLDLSEARRIFRFRLIGEGVRVFDYNPGQYAVLSFPGRGILSAPRPFTIVSPPEEGGFLEFCVKDVDAWTGALKGVLSGLGRRIEGGGRAGASPEALRARVSGPYGNFSFRRSGGTGRFVFLAAGIGANPFISMLRSIARTDPGIRALLIWGGRTREDLWAARELTELGERIPGLRFVPVLSHDPLWTGESGRIGREILERYVGAAFGMAGDDYEWNSASYWICGPRSFRQDLRGMLRDKGIARAALHEERFVV